MRYVYKMSKPKIDKKLSSELTKKELFKGKVFPQFSDVAFQYVNTNTIKASSTATVLFPQMQYAIQDYGLCISENQKPTISDRRVSLGAMTSSSTVNLWRDRAMSWKDLCYKTNQNESKRVNRFSKACTLFYWKILQSKIENRPLRCWFTRKDENWA